MRRVGLVALVIIGVVAGVGASSADTAFSQQVPLEICGAQGRQEPVDIGAPNADGWVTEEALVDVTDIRRFRFTVRQRGTAFVYVGDQWYNLDLGVFSLQSRVEACWRVEARGASTQAERRDLQFVRPDERALEVEPGDYILTARAGDGIGFDPSRGFTVRIAVTPPVCALVPANEPDEQYKGLSKKPYNPDKFQVGVSFQPDERDLGPFALMTFTAYVSPPYTDLFDFTWELDGQVVPGVTEATFLKPYADLPKTPDGRHTVKLTARGAREYRDPTDPQFNFLPFDGGSRSVTCTFAGPA